MQPSLTGPADSGRRRATVDLPIGGLEKLSAVDWPGQLSAVVFCQGCTWRCGYCHNPHLIPFTREPGGPAWDRVLEWLGRRRGLLDSVVFSGGEPTSHSALGKAMRQARELGFKIGLHTGGPSPERLERLIPWLDWVGFDFKAPGDSYAMVTGRDDGKLALRSLKMLLEAGTPLEIRTTWHPQLLSQDDLRSMAQTLADLGCVAWVIQRFRPDGCANPQLLYHPVGEPPLAALQHEGLHITVR